MTSQHPRRTPYQRKDHQISPYKGRTCINYACPTKKAFEIRVSLGNVFNCQVNTLLERDVSKQALYFKGSEKISKHGQIVDFLNKRESILLIWSEIVTRMKDVSTLLIFANSRSSRSRYGKLNWTWTSCRTANPLASFLSSCVSIYQLQQTDRVLRETTFTKRHTETINGASQAGLPKGQTIGKQLYHLKCIGSLRFAEINLPQRLKNLPSVYQDSWQETEKADKECSRSFHLQENHHESLWSQPHSRSIGSTQVWFYALNLSSNH